MITQSSQEYDPSKYVKSCSRTGPPPPAYTCFRCGKQGHWIKNCPTNIPNIKRSTGIPRSFMVAVDGPEHKGALLTSSGDYAVPLINYQAYKEVKKEKPPFVSQDEPVVEPEPDIPEELLCVKEPPPLRQPYSNQTNRRDNISDNYSNDREDYHSSYDSRHTDCGSRRNNDYDRSRESRYHQSNTLDYMERGRPDFDVALCDPSHPDCSPPRQVLEPPPLVSVPLYALPLVPLIPPPHFLPPVFSPQPPEESHINIAQPPPPGVGPLLPVATDAVFKGHPYENENPLKAVVKHKERSIDDRMEEFQRKLNKRDRKYVRGSHSRSQSPDRHRSRSSSRSRSFSSSKSWSRSISRSLTRSSRSRSRTPISTRSWSKKRSHSRSRSRITTGSRSRSRSRIETRVQRRGGSRVRGRSPRHRTRSRSFSPKRYRSHRSAQHTSKHTYNHPLQQCGGGSSYQPHFGPSHKSERYYDKKSGYPRHEKEIGHRIPGCVGDRPRDYKPTYRNTRDQHKEIGELPQIPESEMRAMQSKEQPSEETVKRKEEKVVSKHKKHHYHHKSKDAKKKDKSSSREKLSVESPKNIEMGKEKKHKHKKRKASDHLVKKKRSCKKRKSDREQRIGFHKSGRYDKKSGYPRHEEEI